MPTDNLYEVYDEINTIAVYWLKKYSEKTNQPLCLNNFNIKEKSHLWLLEMFKHFSLYSCYCDFYIKTNIFIYIYLRIFKKIKHLKYCFNKSKVSLINCSDFIEDLTKTFERDKFITEQIYDEYYLYHK